MKNNTQRTESRGSLERAVSTLRSTKFFPGIWETSRGLQAMNVNLASAAHLIGLIVTCSLQSYIFGFLPKTFNTEASAEKDSVMEFTQNYCE